MSSLHKNDLLKILDSIKEAGHSYFDLIDHVIKSEINSSEIEKSRLKVFKRIEKFETLLSQKNLQNLFICGDSLEDRQKKIQQLEQDDITFQKKVRENCQTALSFLETKSQPNTSNKNNNKNKNKNKVKTEELN
ncbi:hypothetical protein M0813_18749 [Anaeramoeba flamelloides]|uniref:Mediator of RNA polymerase II transcription subunit 11 n=1 Tax=Anaeramoeba flamelloides TaxID=1746091 RepID=A0AAV7YGE0_9EUKA|nr:hypothetical protein M0812_24167 [Anaeramoeba flamelloides]KAJ6247222.1 hypothetical protein M0813_18749 [Anaeramoeba flamelloides]